MPVVIKGADQVKRALRKFDPDLYKEMNKEVGTALKSVSNEAKTKVPQMFLSGAMDQGQDVVSRTDRKRAFPVYNSVHIRKGLTYSLAKKKSKQSGWTAAYSLLNKSAIGAIAEIAGTKNPYGDPRSKSNNPQAGQQYIEALDKEFGSVKKVGKGRGRLMYAALESNEGKAKDAVMKAIDTAQKKFKAATR